MSQHERISGDYHPILVMKFGLSAALVEALRPLVARDYFTPETAVAHSTVFLPTQAMQESRLPLENSIYEGFGSSGLRRSGARIAIESLKGEFVTPDEQEKAENERAFCKLALIRLRLAAQERSLIQSTTIRYPRRLRGIDLVTHASHAGDLAIGVPGEQLSHKADSSERYTEQVQALGDKLKAASQAQGIHTPYYVYGRPDIRPVGWVKARGLAKGESESGGEHDERHNEEEQ